MTLKFNAKTHRYWLDGKPIPGVTSLLSGGVPKPQLTYWSARTVAEWVADNPAEVEALRAMGRGPMVNALKEVPWQKRDTAAVRGTDVHALAEELVHGREVEVPEHLVGYVEGYVRWLDEWQPTPILTERPVASRRWWYAGTFDLIADMAGERWLLDVKTASGIYGEVAMQTDAYRNAEFYVDENGDEQPMPEGITRLGAIHVQETSSVLVPLDSTGAPFKDFLHAQWVANAKNRIKGYVGEPLHTPPLPDSQTAGAA